jgi:hypothetical protein
MESGTLRRQSEGVPLHGDTNRLLADLNAFESNPHLSLLTMQAELDVDLGLWLGFEPDLATTSPAAVLEKQLSAEQYEAIKSFEEVVKIFCAHSAYSPRELGGWLNGPRRNFRYKTPMDILFQGFTDEGFDREQVAEVLREGDVIFGIHPYGETYIESLLAR